MFSYFSSNSATPAEKENAAALKAIIKDHKSALKVELKQYEAEYKIALKVADAEYKRAKEQAKVDVIRKTLLVVTREVDTISATQEYANSDAKTKGKIQKFRAWMDNVTEKHLEGEVESDFLEAEEVEEVYVDEKKVQSLAV
ncbi:hypothetical protein BGZ98_004319 [Dissophora globulifera]|nr:hypothetical protein BGZ98_004319 [Dissophora globulifera]